MTSSDCFDSDTCRLTAHQPASWLERLLARTATDSKRPVAVIRQYKVGYENSLAETINGLYKAEIIHRSGPRKTKQAVELATLEWVSWFNHHRLMGPLGNVPPAELKANHHQQREVRQ